MADDLEEEWWKEDADEKEDSDDGDDKADITDTPMKDAQAKESKTEKKKKKRKKKNITEELKEKGDVSGTPSDVVGYLKKHFEGKLSAVEFDEISLDLGSHFHEANSSPGFPVAYLRGILSKWKKLKASHQGEGSPLLLVISSSALRAVQLNRQIQEFKGDNCKCAKLFAKHMKLEEQQKFLKKSVCHIGVGTPNRILTLVKSGHLNLDKLTAIVIDWNWRDVKQRRLVDIPEIRAELASLMQTHLIPHIKSQKLTSSSSCSCKIGIL